MDPIQQEVIDLMHKTDVVKPEDYTHWEQNIIAKVSSEKLQKIKAVFEKALKAKADYQAKKVKLLKEKFVKIKDLYKTTFKKDREAKEQKIKDEEALELSRMEEQFEQSFEEYSAQDKTVISA